jgi:SAM-dependent methyltransferase
MRVLDIGCGPAEILAYLPDVDYRGFDISETYVARARKRFGSRGQFHSGTLTTARVEEMPPFDVVIAMGVLHHLDDDQATEVLRIAHQALKPGGRLLTVDSVLVPGQNPIARLLAKLDRGQNVRTREGYLTLARTIFESPVMTIHHRGGIPYTVCIMECTRLSARLDT